MPVVVVGGGIVGIVASFILADRGEKVVLVETASELGGLLRGTTSSDGEMFDTGTHILSTTGLHSVDDILLSAVDELPVNEFDLGSGDIAGAIDDDSVNHESCFASIESQERLCEGLISHRASSRASAEQARNAAEELYRLYGQPLGNVFAEHVTRVFGVDAQKISPLAVKLLALHRVVMPTMKLGSSVLDMPGMSEVFAHRRRSDYRASGNSRCIALYPRKRGLGRYITILGQNLVTKGVDVRTRARVVMEGRDLIVHCSNGEERFSNPRVIWTAGLPAAAKVVFNENYVPERAPNKSSWVVDVTLRCNPLALESHYYYIRGSAYHSYRLTNYRALTLDPNERSLTFEITVDSTVSEIGVRSLVLSDLRQLSLSTADHDAQIVSTRKLPFSFLLATSHFDEWSANMHDRLCERLELYGPWSKPRLFFTGDCLRDVASRL